MTADPAHAVADSGRIRTSGIDHIHLHVANLDRFIDLIGRLFEAECSIPSHVDSIDALNSTVRLAGATAAPFLDVFQAAGPGGPVARAVARSGEGLAAVSFRVDDIDTAAAHAAACGLREVSRIGFPGVMTQVQFHPADTFGFMLELVQYEPGAQAAIAEIQRRKATGLPVEGLSIPSP